MDTDQDKLTICDEQFSNDVDDLPGFHGFTDTDVPTRRNIDTEEVSSDIEILPDYIVHSKEGAHEMEELYQTQDFSWVKEQEEVSLTVSEKKKKEWNYLSGIPALITGTKSRLKVTVIDKFPVTEIPRSHLPRTDIVLLRMIQLILEDVERKNHSNPLTVATSAAIKRSADLVIPEIKAV